MAGHHCLPRRLPLTLIVGVALIAITETLLFIDVYRRGGAVAPAHIMPEPVGALGLAARWAAYNITAVCWVGYLLLADGLLVLLARRRGRPDIASIRARPNRFLVAWLTSIPVWCVFDFVNFHLMHAWTYHGLPEQRLLRFVGYVIAFAAISPGMFLTAQWLSHAGLRRWRTPGAPRGNRIAAWGLIVGVITLLVGITAAVMTLGVKPWPTEVICLSAAVMLLPGLVVAGVWRCPYLSSFTFGLCLTAWSIGIADPIGNMLLWVGLIYLLDPINHRLGGPSILADWLAGRWGRTAALMAGGAVCGLLWELWNYWALSKWTYDLPFLGSWQQVRYFEMPLAGFAGFLPFAVECWVMLNVIISALNAAGLRLAETLSDDDHVL